MNQSVIESLTHRMDQLERENRRLKKIGGAGLAVLALFALMGAGVSGQRTIEAEEEKERLGHKQFEHQRGEGVSHLLSPRLACG